MLPAVDYGAGSLLSHGATKYPSMELQASPASKLRRATLHVASSRRAAKVTPVCASSLSNARENKLCCRGCREKPSLRVLPVKSVIIGQRRCCNEQAAVLQGLGRRRAAMLQRYVGVATDDERRCCKDMAAMLPRVATQVLPPQDSVCCQGSIAMLPWRSDDATKVA